MDVEGRANGGADDGMGVLLSGLSFEFWGSARAAFSHFNRYVNYLTHAGYSRGACFHHVQHKESDRFNQFIRSPVHELLHLLLLELPHKSTLDIRWRYVITLLVQGCMCLPELWWSTIPRNGYSVATFSFKVKVKTHCTFTNMKIYNINEIFAGFMGNQHDEMRHYFSTAVLVYYPQRHLE